MWWKLQITSEPHGFWKKMPDKKWLCTKLSNLLLFFLGLLGSEDTDSCCDENCKLRPNARCSDKNSPCCIGCNYMSAGQKCRTENYATCKEKAVCSGGQAICPASLPMPDGTQ